MELDMYLVLGFVVGLAIATSIVAVIDYRDSKKLKETMKRTDEILKINQML